MNSRAREPSTTLAQRLEIVRLRAAGHRLELALERQEFERRTEGVRRALSMVTAMVRRFAPARRPHSRDAGVSAAGVAALAASIVLPWIVRRLTHGTADRDARRASDPR